MSPFFAIVIYIIAILTAYFLNQKYKINTNSVRYESIDGFRGLLALGVFIHHASIWSQYLKTGTWSAPESMLYAQLGQTSVTFFFMITSFLFVSKLLNATDKKFNWNAFFISRLFRLFPMYLVSIVCIVFIVLVISDFKLNVSFMTFLKDFFYWSTFTLLGCPLINNNPYTNNINAGIVWTLQYEWLFYFSLPLISLLVLKKTPLRYLILSMVFLIAFYTYKHINLEHILPFVGGLIAPFILKYCPGKINYKSTFCSLIILICILLIFFFSINYKIMLAVIVFSLVALGNNFFGLLKSPLLKLLGEISYSTYLIHGIIIFITMYFLFGLEKPTSLFVLQFWLIIFAITPIIVCLSFILYVCVEKPCMDYYKKKVLNRFV